MDKINGLSRRYPGLMSLRSVDLSPASWMAVAWHPIYHIPMGRTIKNLSTCFLTYHTLSSSFQDMDPEDDIERPEKKLKKGRAYLFHHLAWQLIRCKEMCGSRAIVDGTKKG
ncbi:hypothetical protein CRYUN_Cryun10bG0074500 [Craigia yunnanensis]